MLIKDNPNFQTKLKPATFHEDDTLQKALDHMCEHNIGSVVIVRHDRTVAGIITERDMLIKVLGKKLDPQKTLVKDVMSHDVKVAKETDELLDWMHTMSNERFRHLPIVNDEGQLVNMVSQGDFVAFTWPDLYASARQNIRQSLSRGFQWSMILFAMLALTLLALNM